VRFGSWRTIMTGGSLYLAEFSNKTRSLIGGIVLTSDEVGMVSDSIGLQLTDLQ
jgi:hypothetical protein